MAGFVARVRAGSASLEAPDDAALGRDRSLATSLAYGFSAFTTGEQARLAVLHLFRDTVNAETLRAMGDLDIAEADAVPVLAHLNTAHAGLQRVLDLLPADHHEYRSAAHNQLGFISGVVGDIPQALHYYQQSIQHKEAHGDTYGAGRTRHNIALLLCESGRPGDALHYARAALDNYRDVGPGAATKAREAEELIHTLEKKIDQGIPDE